jgi:hypothetical protein
MTRAFFVFVGLCLLLGACTQRLICPAYQSAFIYDKDQLRKKFSYFQEDSTPKVYTASKNKYLVAEPVSYRTKLRSMQTVKMKPVLVEVPDSLSGKQDSVSMEDLTRAAQSIRDSIVIVDVPKDTLAEEPLDSIYVITKDKELRLLKYNTPDSLKYDSATQKYLPEVPKYYVADVRYNMEQDNYMWYLRDNLVLPDVRLAKLAQAEGGKGNEGSEKSSGRKKGLKGFFQNLFKKKKKEEVDSAALQAPPKEEFDFIDEADTVSQAEVPQPGQEKKAKKGLFGGKKKADKPARVKEKKPKKEKKSKKDEAVKPEEKKKEEEDKDDGF